MAWAKVTRPGNCRVTPSSEQATEGSASSQAIQFTAGLRLTTHSARASTRMPKAPSSAWPVRVSFMAG